MSNNNLNNLNDRELEKALEITLSLKTPDEEITNSVTPWKKAMTMALCGITFTILTPDFFYINYILPIIGSFLLLFGFRRMRIDSREFKACYILSWAKIAASVFAVFLNSTIYASGDLGSTVGNINLVVSLISSFGLITALTLAIRKTQINANMPVNIKSAIAMMILYLVMLIWALLETEVPLFGWAVIISYIAILVNLHKIIKSIDKAGYSIKSVSSKISDKSIAIILIIVIVSGIVCGYLFFHSYDMQWEEFSSEEHASVAEIKKDLKNKGFPENVLNDMSNEDIEACKGALKVYSETEEQFVDESIDELGINFNAHETKEIRFTHILLRLDEEGDMWRYITYFEWLGPENFYGTEAIQIWSDHGCHWVDSNGYFGRVLYTENGKDYASPFFEFGNQSYIDETPILGGSKNDVFAKFSFPEGDLKQRGYISYTGEAKGTITGAWINYCHQKTFLQYPVTSAAKNRQKDLSTDSGAFVVIYDIYNFFIDKENGFEPE